MSPHIIESEALARLLEQTSRAMHSLGFQSDMFPAQWTALRYFARATPADRTASALARYQGIAVGPVTRTVRTLITKGLLTSVMVAGRGGPKRLELTDPARELLAKDPLDLVVKAVDQVDAAGREALAQALEQVLRAIHARHDI
jgi:DNA-binding MarR family transcriptional regulator